MPPCFYSKCSSAHPFQLSKQPVSMKFACFNLQPPQFLHLTTTPPIKPTNSVLRLTCISSSAISTTKWIPNLLLV
jgi:hypothetical protein